MKCAWCGSTTWTFLGYLGDEGWYRCIFCGADQHTTEDIALDPWYDAR